MGSNNIIAEIQRDHMYNLLMRGERVDGRAFDEYRPISIETGVIARAEGSAHVKIGESQVVVGVKIQIGTPFSDTPDKGVIITNAELIPMASPSFESGPPKDYAIELARLVDRGIRESKALDLDRLCIEEGEKVWMVFIDIHALDYDGNLVDAASLGALAALLTATIPNKKYEVSDEDVQLTVREMPIAVTAIEFEGEIMVDPCLHEEAVASSRITVISNQDGSICGIQKIGTDSLTEDQVNRAVDMAINKAREIRERFFINI